MLAAYKYAHVWMTVRVSGADPTDAKSASTPDSPQTLESPLVQHGNQDAPFFFLDFVLYLINKSIPPFVRDIFMNTTRP
jgi:hypothetical protein